MSDLISRSIYKSKLLKALDVLNKEYREAILNEDSDLILAIQNQQSAYMLALRLLDNEPTAYDIDRVVEELEKNASRYTKKYATPYGNNGYKDIKAISVHKAIEIVKQEAEQYQSSEIGFISKTEVLTLIEEIKCNDDIPKNYGTLLDIMRMIRNIPTVDNTDNGWIPCSERLPKYGEVVMCSCTNGGITISCITHKGVTPSKSVRFGQHSVIAWQPLPQPYQPKGE